MLLKQSWKMSKLLKKPGKCWRDSCKMAQNAWGHLQKGTEWEEDSAKMPQNGDKSPLNEEKGCKMLQNGSEMS